MADHGYIKFYRSALTHPFFRDDAERMAWLRLLSAAAWKPYQKRAGEHLVDLDRGEVVGAVRYLSDEWGWSRGKVERFLKRLENEGMVETQTETGITIITICNYNEYQGGDEDIETPMVREPRQSRDGAETEPRRGRDRVEANIEEIKHLRSEEVEEGEASNARSGLPAERQPSLLPDDGEGSKPKRKRAKPRSAMDPDLELSPEGWAHARDRGWNDQHIQHQFQKFKDFHIARGNLMADWPAAWRTWVGNDYDRKPRGGGAPRTTRSESIIEGIIEGVHAHERDR